MDEEEKQYLATRGGEVEPPKVEKAATEVETEAETEVPVEAEAEEEVPVLEKPGLAVPYNRFKEEREKRKAEKERADELERKVARFEGELTALKSTVAKPPEVEKPVEKPIDWDQDPKAAHENVAKAAAELKARLEAQEKETQRRNAHERFMADYRARVGEYAEKAPEFKDAYTFLFESRVNEYVTSGMSKQQAEARTLQDEEQTVLHALMNNKNPGEVLHNVAKARGFAPKVTGGDDKVKTVEKAAKVSTTIGGSSGGGNAGPTTLEALADMDADEFRKVMADENKRAKFWARYGG